MHLKITSQIYLLFWAYEFIAAFICFLVEIALHCTILIAIWLKITLLDFIYP